jgi:hypothetical protein
LQFLGDKIMTNQRLISSLLSATILTFNGFSLTSVSIAQDIPNHLPLLSKENQQLTNFDHSFFKQIETENNNFSESENLLDQFLRKKPIIGGKQGDYCFVAPRDHDTTWNPRPRFIWDGQAKQISVVNKKDENTILWSYEVTNPSQNNVLYGTSNDPEITYPDLIPGEEYYYIVIYEATSTNGKPLEKKETLPFDVLAPNIPNLDREQILAQLPSLPADNIILTTEERQLLALERANIFDQYDLTWDVLQELYAVENSTPHWQNKLNNYVTTKLCKRHISNQ